MAPEVPSAVSSVGIIGAGAVGRTVAAAVVSAALCKELVLVSRSVEEVAALAADLDDLRVAAGSPVVPAAASTAYELDGCDAVVIAARARFVNTRRDDMRMSGLHENAPLIRDLAFALRGYAGQVVMVTNPVDIMARLFAEVSGCERVVGIGSNLDSARYRLIVAQLLGVGVETVCGSVIGEHGDSMTICVHATTVAGQRTAIPVRKVRCALARRSPTIMRMLGRTRYGPSGAALSTLRKCLGMDDGMEELAHPYGGGFLGVRLRFTGGLSSPCLPPLSPCEARRFKASDDKLREIYQRLHRHL